MTLIQKQRFFKKICVKHTTLAAGRVQSVSLSAAIDDGWEQRIEIANVHNHGLCRADQILIRKELQRLVDASAADPQRHVALIIGDMNQILEGHTVFALDSGEVTKTKTCFASIPCFWKEALSVGPSCSFGTRTTTMTQRERLIT